ncbi:MAG: hypothetical protein QW775_05165 [Ignisphaera sp.]|uniref:Uncharacterized protein n=1 Tax=Ignisphaera aggregans TaxID=334771 RepID=A0A7C4JKL5_9CREN
MSKNLGVTRITTIILLVSSILFLVLSSWFIWQERYIQALLTFVIGLILLSSYLAIIREEMTLKAATTSS